MKLCVEVLVFNVLKFINNGDMYVFGSFLKIKLFVI